MTNREQLEAELKALRETFEREQKQREDGLESLKAEADLLDMAIQPLRDRVEVLNSTVKKKLKPLNADYHRSAERLMDQVETALAQAQSDVGVEDIIQKQKAALVRINEDFAAKLVLIEKEKTELTQVESERFPQEEQLVDLMVKQLSKAREFTVALEGYRVQELDLLMQLEPDEQQQAELRALRKKAQEQLSTPVVHNGRQREAVEHLRLQVREQKAAYLKALTGVLAEERSSDGPPSTVGRVLDRTAQSTAFQSPLRASSAPVGEKPLLEKVLGQLRAFWLQNSEQTRKQLELAEQRAARTDAEKKKVEESAAAFQKELLAQYGDLSSQYDKTYSLNEALIQETEELKADKEDLAARLRAVQEKMQSPGRSSLAVMSPSPGKPSSPLLMGTRSPLAPLPGKENHVRASSGLRRSPSQEFK